MFQKILLHSLKNTERTKMASKKKHFITKTFPLEVTGTLNWILDTSFEEFEKNIKNMPISLLLQEYGSIKEAIGCLIVEVKAKKKDYYKDSRRTDLRRREEILYQKILQLYYEQVSVVAEIDYWSDLEHSKSVK